MLLFLYVAEVMSTGQNLSDGSRVGNYAGNEQPSSTPVNRVGELSVSFSGTTPEIESQKVSFVLKSGMMLMGIIL